MSFYIFVLYDKYFWLVLFICGEYKWINNVYIVKLYFIFKYDNRFVEIIYYKVGGVGLGFFILLWNIWKVIKWYVYDEYMILKIMKVICKYVEFVYLYGIRVIECGYGGVDCDIWWKFV